MGLSLRGEWLASLRELRQTPGFFPIILIFTLVFFGSSFVHTVTGDGVRVLISYKLEDYSYNTYAVAAKKIFEFVDPYPRKEFDFQYGGYKYSPLFGVLFHPFQYLPLKWGPFLWIVLNFCVFMAALGVFLCHSYRSKDGSALLRQPGVLVTLLVLIFNETMVSTLSSQANSLVCGLMLLGLVFYSLNRDFEAGLILALASNFKVFPLALALLLLLDFRARYWMAFWGAFVIALVLPAIVLGWSWNMELLSAWHRTLFLDFNTESKLSLMKFLAQNFSFGESRLYKGFIGLNMLLLCAIYRYYCSARTATRNLRYLYSLAALFILLFNHRTEIELFVLASPVYAVMFLDIMEKRNGGENTVWEIFILVTAYFFITIIYLDPVPYAVRDFLFQDKGKMLGVLILYVYFVYRAFTQTNRPCHTS